MFAHRHTETSTNPPFNYRYVLVGGRGSETFPALAGTNPL